MTDRIGQHLILADIISWARHISTLANADELHRAVAEAVLKIADE